MKMECGTELYLSAEVSSSLCMYLNLLDLIREANSYPICIIIVTVYFPFSNIYRD